MLIVDFADYKDDSSPNSSRYALSVSQLIREMERTLGFIGNQRGEEQRQVAIRKIEMVLSTREHAEALVKVAQPLEAPETKNAQTSAAADDPGNSDGAMAPNEAVRTADPAMTLASEARASENGGITLEYIGVIFEESDLLQWDNNIAMEVAAPQPGTDTPANVHHLDGAVNNTAMDAPLNYAVHPGYNPRVVADFAVLGQPSRTVNPRDLSLPEGEDATYHYDDEDATNHYDDEDATYNFDDFQDFAHFTSNYDHD